MGVDSDAVLEAKELLNFDEIDCEKWMHLPRKFSRGSARFELPTLKELVRIKPLEYFSKFVFVEDDKKQLYHRIFVKFLPKDNRQENDNEEFFSRSMPGDTKKNGKEDLLFNRCIQGESFTEALKEVLGFHGTEEKLQEILSYLEFNAVEEVPINFRTFSGIVAFSERLITTLDQSEDPRNEIEIADFETLARHIDKIQSTTMKNVLNIVQK